MHLHKKSTNIKNYRNMRGALITFEGGEWYGLTDVVQRVVNTLNKDRGTKAEFIHFFNIATPVGAMLHTLMSSSEKEVNRSIEHLMVAACMFEARDEIIDKINKGITVIMNRYVYSHLFSALWKGLDPVWAETVFKNMPEPDVVIAMKLDSVYASSEESREVTQKLLDYGRRLDKPWVTIEASNMNETLLYELVNRLSDATKVVERDNGAQLRMLTKVLPAPIK